MDLFRWIRIKNDIIKLIPFFLIAISVIKYERDLKKKLILFNRK